MRGLLEALYQYTGVQVLGVFVSYDTTKDTRRAAGLPHFLQQVHVG